MASIVTPEFSEHILLLFSTMPRSQHAGCSANPPGSQSSDGQNSLPTTIPTGSDRRSHSSHQQNSSSGETSVESRIDSTDRWRFGGPGPLPDWPIVHTGLFDEIQFWVQDEMVRKAAIHLDECGLYYSSVQVVTRFSRGTEATLRDTTLLIRGDLSTRHSEWLSVLDDILSVALKLDWPGRVEVIDERVSGIRTFTPTVGDRVIERWQSITDKVISEFSDRRIPWVLIEISNRGYWEAVSVPTVVVKVSTPNPPAGLSSNSALQRRNVTSPVI